MMTSVTATEILEDFNILTKEVLNLRKSQIMMKK